MLIYRNKKQENMMSNNSKKERFNERKEDFLKCVYNLKEAVEQPKNSFIRDSVIKRFECCWETGWKLLKLWLEEQGIIAPTPRQVWKESFAVGVLCGEADTWTEAQQMRNLTIHTYDEETAEQVYDFVCNEALPLFQELGKKVEKWTHQ